MERAGLIGGVGAWVVALAFGLGSAAWPEYIKPHPYVVIGLGIAGFLMLSVPVIQRFFPIFKEGNRPRIAFSTQIGKTFTLVHLGGDAAQHIQVAPIQSALGKPLWIRFSGVDFLDVKRPEAYLYFRLDRDGNLTAERDMEKVRYVFFRRDTEGRETVDYPVTIVFQWKGRSIRERQTLTWHSASMALTTSGVSK